jgi:uncharacterized protein (TIGR00255 family)
MIQSMTGFAEKKFNCSAFSLRISIKTLNHRFLDWHCRGNHIGELENRLRDRAREQIHRGRVDVYLDFEFSDPDKWDLVINDKLLKKILDAFRRSAAGDQSSWDFRVDNILSIPHLFEMKRKDFTKQEAQFIKKGFMDTLESLVQARKKEGEQLKRDIKSHLDKVKKAVERTAELAEKQPRRIQENMREKIHSLTRNSTVSEEKIVEEAAFAAQKYDFYEEIERLHAHVARMDELICRPSGPVGRQLDFLAQEILRETNTINSKAQDLAVVQECLAVKTELESIRQQVQNLE